MKKFFASKIAKVSTSFTPHCNIPLKQKHELGRRSAVSLSQGAKQQNNSNVTIILPICGIKTKKLLS